MLHTNKTLSQNNPYFLVSTNENESIEAHHLAQAQLGLKKQGWALFRGFQHNLDSFNDVISHFCQQITFDPAREFTTSMSQKVDAGTQAVGLHIENGNTPFPPSFVAFYSQKSAFEGSQTTLCDGISLYESLPNSLQKRFETPITVTRSLPETLWKTYVSNEHPDLTADHTVTKQHLDDVLNMIPGQSGTLNKKGELDYHLQITPLSRHNGKTAFANALLGPSFNYQKPIYHHADGSLITQSELDLLAEYAEAHTYELNWKDGDIIIIDNTRVMHGRRAILGNPDERQLVIAMGRSA